MIPRLPNIAAQEYDKKLVKAYQKIQRLIDALNEKEIPLEVTDAINEELMVIDGLEGDPKTLKKKIEKSYRKIVSLLQKKVGLVPKGYYHTYWMTLGMSIFGIPFGMIFSFMNDNFGLIGIGFPIGMAIGMAIGTHLDKKALAEGKQLNFSEDCQDS